MQGSLRTVLVVAIVAVTGVLVFKILFGGPGSQTGRCVGAANAFVDCDDAAAVYRLVREVESERECPADSLKLYVFARRVYCGVALRGAPKPSAEYVPCLLLAGAKLAGAPAELRFARGEPRAPRGIVGGRPGTVKVRGDGWRVFYVLFKGQLDPGFAAIVARPAAVAFVAYFDDAARQREQIAAATRCRPGAAGAAGAAGAT